jgi:hypothetical protein
MNRRLRAIATLLALAAAVWIFFIISQDRRIRGHDLIALWPLEANASKEHRYENALSGDVAIVETEVGRAFSFKGANGRVTVSNAPSLNFGAGEAFSVMAWIQPEHQETPFGVMSIVEKRKPIGISSALGYSLHLEDGKLSCQLAPFRRVGISRSDFTSPRRLLAAWRGRNQLAPMKFARFIGKGPDLRDGQFHHVALTLERRSKTGGKLYVDGNLVLVFDPTGQAGTFANTEPLLIGTHPDPTLHCGFKGLIAGVRVSSYALSKEQVQAVMRADIKDGSKGQ